MTFGRKKIFYAKNCEALAETLPWLFFKGYSLVNIKIPSYINKKSIIDERDLVWLNSKLGKTMDKSLTKIFNVNNYSETIKTIILGRISYGLKTSLDTVKNLEKFFDENLKDIRAEINRDNLNEAIKKLKKIVIANENQQERINILFAVKSILVDISILPLSSKASIEFSKKFINILRNCSASMFA